MLIRVLGGGLLLAGGLALLAVGVAGWRERLPRNRFAGVRTPVTMSSDAAFQLANRVAAPAVAVSGGVAVAGGAAVTLARSETTALTLLAVAGLACVGLAVVGGLVGHRAAAACSQRCAGCELTNPRCPGRP